MASSRLVSGGGAYKVTDCPLIEGKGPRNFVTGLPVHLASASRQLLVAKAVGQMLDQSGQTG